MNNQGFKINPQPVGCLQMHHFLLSRNVVNRCSKLSPCPLLIRGVVLMSSILSTEPGSRGGTHQDRDPCWHWKRGLPLNVSAHSNLLYTSQLWLPLCSGPCTHLSLKWGVCNHYRLVDGNEVQESPRLHSQLTETGWEINGWNQTHQSPYFSCY